VGFKVFIAVTMPSPWMGRRVALVGTDVSVQFLDNINVVPSSSILVTFKMGQYVPLKRRFLQENHTA
jgi:hypothetical protein